MINIKDHAHKWEYYMPTKTTTSQSPTWATDCIYSVSHPRGGGIFVWKRVEHLPGKFPTNSIPNTYTSLRDFPGRFPMDETPNACSGACWGEGGYDDNIPVWGYGEDDHILFGIFPQMNIAKHVNIENSESWNCHTCVFQGIPLTLTFPGGCRTPDPPCKSAWRPP